MLPSNPMLTTKKRAHIFLIFFVGFSILAGWTGCAPSGARALMKGDKLLSEGKFSEAVQKYEEAVKAYPKNAKAWNHRGLGYQYAGDPKKAAQAYQQALALDRNLTAAAYNFGVLQLEQGNYSEAISRLTTFTQLEPKDPHGWLKLGTAQLEYAARASGSDRTRQLDSAKRSLDYSQKLEPSAETSTPLVWCIFNAIVRATPFPVSQWHCNSSPIIRLRCSIWPSFTSNIFAIPKWRW